MKPFILLLLCVGTAALQKNVPVTPENTANVKIRAIIDGVEQTTGKVASFNPDGYITAVQSTSSLAPTQIPEFGGWTVFALPIAGNSGENHTIKFTPDGSTHIELSPLYTFVINDGVYIEFNGTAPPVSPKEDSDDQTGVYVGIVVAVLAVIGIIVYFVMGKKGSPAVAYRNSQAVAYKAAEPVDYKTYRFKY